MATTPNFNLPLYDGADTAKLDTLLNGISTQLDTNLETALRARGAYRIGTDAARLALTGGALFEGLRFWTTDTRAEWFYSGGSWSRALPGRPFAVAVGRGTTNSAGAASVTFPSGRFTVAPIVTIASGAAGRIASQASVTASGFTATLTTGAGAGVAGDFSWSATQMTPTAAAG